MKRAAIFLLLPLILPLCEGGGGVEGKTYNYSISLAYQEDTCNQGDQGLEYYTYTLEISGNDVTIDVDGQEWFYGMITGDTISYKSKDWTQERDDGAVTYYITGLGNVSESSWSGEEIIHILSSEDPLIPAPCVYQYSLEGERVD